MCTVVIHVPEPDAPAHDRAVRLLAIRDEDPERPWRPLGPWWPQTHPALVGVQDVRAGGAWLAADVDTGRLAVLLNRAETLADPSPASRGGRVLARAAGRRWTRPPRTHGFNLVDVAARGARLLQWNGIAERETAIPPGTHMIAHDDLDDPATPRIARWLDAFRSAPPAAGDAWWEPWLDVLDTSAGLAADDDEAIVRDNRPHGYPTQSLLVCVASIDGDGDGADVRYGELPEPAAWARVRLRPPERRLSP